MESTVPIDSGKVRPFYKDKKLMNNKLKILTNYVEVSVKVAPAALKGEDSPIALLSRSILSLD
jgi:hypothetical protein